MASSLGGGGAGKRCPLLQACGSWLLLCLQQGQSMASSLGGGKEEVPASAGVWFLAAAAVPACCMCMCTCTYVCIILHACACVCVCAHDVCC